MFKFMFSVFFLLLTACSTNSNLAPIEPTQKASNNDLEGMSNCQTIEKKIIESQEVLDRYKKSKSLNTSANILSGVALILSLGMDRVDYVSNNDLNSAIKSYEDRLKALHILQDKHCSRNDIP